MGAADDIFGVNAARWYQADGKRDSRIDRLAMPTVELPHPSETTKPPFNSVTAGTRANKIRVKDAISRCRACLRRLKPFRVIAHKTLRGPYTHSQFIETTSEIQRTAVACRSIPEKTRAFWQMEKLGFSYCRNDQGQLNDSRIPHGVQPISHVGLGIAAVEHSGFQPHKITAAIEPYAHPDYRLFPYESIGCLWAVYSNKWMQFAFRLASRTRLPAVTLPTLDSFLAAFPAEIQSLISHGYGRSLYFRHYNIQSAIRRAVTLSSLDTRSVVQGIAFAYSMINSDDIHQVLEVGQDLTHPDLASGFQDGLVYALVFWEWAFPGFLDKMAPDSARQHSLIQLATQQIALCRTTGVLTAFRVTQP